MAEDNAGNPDGMSQEEIDAAMAASGGGETPARPADESSPAEASAPAEAAANAEQPTQAAATGAEQPATDSGDFSQADIDAALAAAESGAEAQAAPSEDGGFFSQADIDAALAGEAQSAAQPAANSYTNADGSVKLDSQGRPFDEAAAMMEAAIAEERAAAAAQKAAQAAAAAAQPQVRDIPPPAGSVPLELPDFGADDLTPEESKGISLLSDVKLDVKIELGRAEMYIEEVLKLGEGAVVELDKLAGDPVDVLVNDRLVARGEVLVLNDNFCVRISEIMPASDEAA